MRERKLGVRALGSLMGTAVALATLLAVAPAEAQMCETDADCGFGFSCHQEVVSNPTTSGSGVSSTSVGTTGGPPECGNAFCEETETTETCPDDCYVISYCVGAQCEADSECAEDYSCQPAGGVYTTTTTGGDGPLCGDLECDVSESAETCSVDCSTERTCQIKRCETDADCDEGFYCDLRGGVGVASVTGVGGGPGSGGHIELYQSQCLPVGTNGGSGGGATTDAGESNSSATDGDSGQSSGVSGGTVVSSANVTGGSASGSGGSHTGGNGHHEPWPRGPWRRGCSLAVAPMGGSLPLAGLFGLIAWAQLRRRRR